MIIRKDGTAAVSFVDPADGTRKHADVEGWRKVGTQTAEGGAKYSRFGGEQRRPEDFVPAPDGSLDFGHITDEVAAASNGRFPAAPIRLQEGTPETLGRAHVEIDKSERIKAAGYEDEISYTVKFGNKSRRKHIRKAACCLLKRVTPITMYRR